VDNGADPDENDGKVYEIAVGLTSGTPMPTFTPTASSTPGPSPTPTVGPSLLTFDAIEDAKVEQANPTVNYGGLTFLEVDGSPVRHFLMKFQVSGISGPVVNAKLRLYSIGTAVAGGNIHAAANTWDEATVNWNNAPAAGPTALGSLGGVVPNTWYEVNLTGFVTGNGTYSLRVLPTTTDGAEYRSSEGGATTIPQLVIEFNNSSTPSPTNTPTSTNTATPSPTNTPTSTSTATPSPTNTPTSTSTATPTPEPGGAVHVGDLDGSSTPSGNRWNAQVVVTVHNGSEGLVAGATVNGSWSNGTTGTGSCVTNGSGQCTVSKNNLGSGVASVTFTVTNVAAAGQTYAPGSNHDPDADSNGTSIIVPKTGNPTPTPDPGGVMHVGDLDGSSAPAPNSRWTATVTFTVHNAGHAPVSGATVSGSWSAGATGSASCVTNASGQCSVSKTGLRTNVNSVTFSVTNVTKAGSSYSAAANHDPEADSNGTVIVVAKP
jgi:hypothetical protein